MFQLFIKKRIRFDDFPIILQSLFQCNLIQGLLFISLLPTLSFLRLPSFSFSFPFPIVSGAAHAVTRNVLSILWPASIYDIVRKKRCTGKDKNSKTVRMKNYYDNYDFRSQPGFNNGNFPAGTVSAKGHLTGSEMTVPGTTTQLYTAYYYDIQGRVTRTVQTNLLGGYDKAETVYTFDGRPQKVTRTHTASGKTTRTEVYDYTYDHAARLTKVEHTLNGSKVTLCSYTYDELGRLQSKTPHGTAANKLNYSYNIRDWVTGISGAKFSQSLYYTDGVGIPQYNGNISSMTWRSGDETALRGYQFTYDGLNRLTLAKYGENPAMDRYYDIFNERVTAYDKNGNILGLQRNGQIGAGDNYGMIDNLTYTLNGNQLARVDDAVGTAEYNGGFEFRDAVQQADEYDYDANGNLTKDLNRNISNIEYNFLNLPGKVVFGDGSTIEYVYAADGTKLRTTHVINGTTTTTDYCGNVVYENGVQKYLLTEEGYVTFADNKYHYYLQDHQGNNRVVVDGNGTVEEVNHYYPFGGTFASTSSVQPYKYNGKEFDTKNGLNWYDYGARMYDPSISRFTTMDRFADKYSSMSPYQYGANNPACNIDINGDSIIVNPNPNGLIDHVKMLFGFQTNYQHKINGMLSQIKQADPLLNNMVQRLEESPNNVIITEISDYRKETGKMGNITRLSKGTLENPIETTIEFSPDNQQTNNRNNRPSIIGLVHELGHVDDIIQGKGIYIDRHELQKGSIIERTKLMKAETHPIKMENIMRGILKLNPRNPQDYLRGK